MFKELHFKFVKQLLIVVAIVAVLVVSSLSFGFFSRKGDVERSIVGIINLDGSLVSSSDANWVNAAISQAMYNSSVKAVVLKVDSPGGYAHLVEEIYLDVLELAKRKPVVSSVVTALSGGYYIAVASDYIYVLPTSMVGNVGVIGTGPPTLIPSETVMETGPYKATGFSRLLFPFNLSHALDSFASAVEASREDSLRLSSKELKKGLIYMGSEAVNVGLADEVGSLLSAVKHAADEAGLVEYRASDIIPRTLKEEASGANSSASNTSWNEISIDTLNRVNPPPAIYYLYLPIDAYVQSLVSQEPAEDGGSTGEKEVVQGGSVIVDLSHGNKVSPWVFDLLSAELARRGVYLGYGSTWQMVEASLDSASCLIVAAPTEAYTKEEFKIIDDFVSNGRMLLMFFDPSIEFLETSSLLGPINSLANRYGLSFGKGYLYDEETHYGLYRNIYLTRFANTSLTKNLSNLVFFTATYLHHTDSDVAWTSSDTYSSTAEKRGVYSPIALIQGNGTTAAFGDITFLMEPYCYVEDNYKLVLNIVLAIKSVKVPVENGVTIEGNVTRPDLPVGTVKTYMEEVDGEESQLTWVRTTENSTLVERPDLTTRYYYDENGSLLTWESDGMKIVYDGPLPDLPYPLTESKGWTYSAGYNLTLNGDSFRGRLTSKGSVVGFEELEAGDREKYFCAKIRFTEKDYLDREGSNITALNEGYSWHSSEAGLIRSESNITYFMEGLPVKEEIRRLNLTSIQKGEE